MANGSGNQKSNWANLLGGAAQGISTTTGAIGTASPATYGGTQQASSWPQQSYNAITPMPTYYIPHVPVIPHNYPEPIHLQTKDGKIHSFTPLELFRLAGLEW